MVFSNLLIQAIQQGVVGQEYAIAALVRAATLAMAGIVRKDRPASVLLFIGPASSGKTYIASCFARAILGDERKMLRADCQRLTSDGDPISNLLRQLTTELRRSGAIPTPTCLPASVILLERVDQTSAEVRENLASEIERGEIVVGGGYFSLRNSFIILTATLSKKKADQLIGRPIGFFRDGEVDGGPNQHLIALEEMDNSFGGRLVSTIDEIVILDRPNEQNIVEMFERHLGEIEGVLARFSVGFMIDQNARSFLLGRALEDLSHGTRQLSRAVRNYLEFPLADLRLSGQLFAGTTVAVEHQRPRTFLNFHILIPRLTTGLDSRF
jgi:ATP-dependent Clp protease ATP-binding subunit ClpA